ncbi:MAG TPA: GntR family transcriptional regulator [Hyphomicrobiaceae bacterium]|jgi:GntR family transcriptional regulator|nr:GntR family transcriptional regulator [Hyphomicrobiaceae bacterium]
MAHANHRIFGSTPIPRYVQLAELFRQRVDKGYWPPGGVLPSIEQLMVQFDVARVTVRQAIALLASEGLLSPQRGRGTFVTGTPRGRRRLKVETTLADLVTMYSGDKPAHATLTEGPATPTLFESDGIAAPKYYHMRRVHSRNGERYCVISLYIDYRVFRRAPRRLRRELVLPILTSLPRLRITEARQTLTISTADVETARLLGIPVNAPIAEVRRIMCDPTNTVIYLAEVSYRGDYIHLEMDLRP